MKINLKKALLTGTALVAVAAFVPVKAAHAGNTALSLNGGVSGAVVPSTGDVVTVLDNTLTSDWDATDGLGDGTNDVTFTSTTGATAILFEDSTGGSGPILVQNVTVLDNLNTSTLNVQDTGGAVELDISGDITNGVLAGTNDLAIVLTDGGAGTTLAFDGGAAQSVYATIDGAGAGQGLLNVANAAGVTFQDAIGTTTLDTITIDTSSADSAATFMAGVATANGIVLGNGGGQTATATFDATNGGYTVGGAVDGDGAATANVVVQGGNTVTTDTAWGANNALSDVTVTGAGTILSAGASIGSATFTLAAGGTLATSGAATFDDGAGGDTAIDGAGTLDIGAATTVIGSIGAVTPLTQLTVENNQTLTVSAANASQVIDAGTILLNGVANDATLALTLGTNAIEVKDAVTTTTSGKGIITGSNGAMTFDGAVGASGAALGSVVVGADTTNTTATFAGNVYATAFTLGTAGGGADTNAVTFGKDATSTTVASVISGADAADTNNLTVAGGATVEFAGSFGANLTTITIGADAKSTTATFDGAVASGNIVLGGGATAGDVNTVTFNTAGGDYAVAGTVTGADAGDTDTVNINGGGTVTATSNWGAGSKLDLVAIAAGSNLTTTGTLDATAVTVGAGSVLTANGNIGDNLATTQIQFTGAAAEMDMAAGIAFHGDIDNTSGTTGVGILKSAATAIDTINGSVGTVTDSLASIDMTGTGRLDITGTVAATTITVSGVGGAIGFGDDVTGDVKLAGAGAALGFGGASKTLTGTVTNTSGGAGNGLIDMSSATDTTITGAVGTGDSLAEIDLGGVGTDTFNSTVNADAINFTANSTVDFKGNVTTANGIDFAGFTGTVDFGTGVTLTGSVVDTGGADNGTVIFDGTGHVTGDLGAVANELLAVDFNGGAGTVTVDGQIFAATMGIGGTGNTLFNSDVPQNIVFNADGTATLGTNGVDAAGTVTTTAGNNTGTLVITDVAGGTSSEIFGNVGAGGAALAAVNFTGNGTAQFDGTIDAAAVNLSGAGSTTTFNGDITGALNFAPGASAATEAIFANNTDISSTIDNTTGGNGIGTLTLNGATGHTIGGNVGATNSLHQITLAGGGTTNFNGTVNADNILYTGTDTANFAHSVISDAIDFAGLAGVANFADGANYAGDIISTGGPSGTVNFAGASNVTAVGSETGSLGTTGKGLALVTTAGASGGTHDVTVAGTIVATDIDINGTGTLTANGNVTTTLLTFNADGTLALGTGVPTGVLTGVLFTGDIDFNGNAGVVNLDHGSTVAGTISGAGGGLVNFGADTLGGTFSAGGTIDDAALTVTSGTLSTNGHLFGDIGPLGDITIVDTVAHHATFNVKDDVTSGGALSVATNGTVNISDGATLTVDSVAGTPTGTFGFQLNKVAGVTSNGQLVITGGGNVDFSASTIAVAQKAGSQPLLGGDLFVLETGAATLSALPANPVENSLLYNYVLSDNTGALDMTVTLNPSVGSIITPGNNKNVAQVILGDLNGSTNTQIIAIQNKLVAATTAQRVNDILESLQPTVDGGSMVASIGVMDSTFDMTDERMADARTGETATGMAAGDTTNGMRVWLQGFGQTASQNEREGIDGYDANTWGGAIGIDSANIMEGGLLGIDFGYGRSNVNSKNINSTDDQIDSYQLTLYGRSSFSRDFFVNGMVAYGWDRNSQTRHDVGLISGLDANSSFDAHQIAARASVGRDFVAGSTTLTPSFVGDYMYYNASSYTETDAGGASLNVNPDSYNQFDLGLALKAAWEFKGDDGSRSKPDLHVGYRYGLMNDKVKATSSFVGTPDTTFVTDGQTPGRGIFNAGADIKFMSSNSWDFTASYDFEAKSGFTSHSGILRAGYRF